MKLYMKLLIVFSLIWLLLPGAGHAETLVVGCDHSFKPFVFKDKDGKLVGFDIDLWDAIAKELGLAYELKPMNFDALIPALIEKKIDVALAGRHVL